MIARRYRLFFLCIFLCTSAVADEISTNAISMPDPPTWVKPLQVQRIVEKVERFLEWDIRKVTVYWYITHQAFRKAHNLNDAKVLAFARASDNSIHIGPNVDLDNFEKVFTHELSHAVVSQKYKTAIPKWLEEGLANYVAKQQSKVDYVWLAEQPYREVHSLVHPFNGVDEAKYHYMASTAVMDMIAAKCNIHTLLQLSVGATMEAYLGTFCRINDLDQTFKAWIKRKSANTYSI